MKAKRIFKDGLGWFFRLYLTLAEDYVVIELNLKCAK